MKTSPWGRVQESTKIADGIIFVSTASHGGFILSDERLAEMPKSLKLNTYAGKNAFEEDCEASLVVLAFPQFFSKQDIDRSEAIFKFFYSNKEAK